MSDLIDRQAAIDALTDENLEKFLDSCYDGELHRYKRSAQRIMASLPSAEPQERKTSTDTADSVITASTKITVRRKW